MIIPFSAALRLSYTGKLVLATGFFDLLHSEHKKFLSLSRKKGDLLLVGVESDARARELKGPGRPFENQSVRARNLDALKLAHYIVPLPDSFGEPAVRENFISVLRPSVLAVSSHSPNRKKKAELIKKYGGRLEVVHTHNPEISTTVIAKRSGKV